MRSAILNQYVENVTLLSRTSTIGNISNISMPPSQYIAQCANAGPRFPVLQRLETELGDGYFISARNSGRTIHSCNLGLWDRGEYTESAKRGQSIQWSSKSIGSKGIEHYENQIKAVLLR